MRGDSISKKVKARKSSKTETSQRIRRKRRIDLPFSTNPSDLFYTKTRLYSTSRNVLSSSRPPKKVPISSRPPFNLKSTLSLLHSKLFLNLTLNLPNGVNLLRKKLLSIILQPNLLSMDLARSPLAQLQPQVLLLLLRRKTTPQSTILGTSTLKNPLNLSRRLLDRSRNQPHLHEKRYPPVLNRSNRKSSNPNQPSRFNSNSEKVQKLRLGTASRRINLLHRRTMQSI
jgi:hypothetical protein